MFGRVAPEVVPVDNPLEAYAMFAGRVMAWLRHMDSLLADVESPRYRGATAEQVRGEVVLFERAMDRANTVLSTYARLNIDDRLAAIQERQADALIQALEAGLLAAGVVDVESVAAARAAAARHLRAV